MATQNTAGRGREISLERAGELADYTTGYREAKAHIPRGTDPACIKRYEAQKAKLLTVLGGTEADWADWKWQMKHRIDDADTLAQILDLSETEKQEIHELGVTYRFAVTPYYLALIDPADPKDPIRAMSVPTALESDDSGESDPMAEEFTNPAGIITRRYPDRLILNVTNACAMFCRHCQRRRRIGDADCDVSRAALDESFAYIRNNPEVRDVLITGGDALALDNDQLEYILSSLRAIESVEMIRFGTRTLVTLPMRIDEGFLAMIEQYHPVYLNTHFNHPRELTPQAVQACAKLCKAGVPLGNQMVLLEGVNNDKYVVQSLNHELCKARVRPYYIFHAKHVKGTTHFCTSIDDGLEIMAHLRGRTSGMAIPTYILNAPGGLGKTPLLPEYIVERTSEKVTLRTWEGKLVEYPNAVN
ncbi:MAG: KamA family radical SAM protein [Oscillospiraceae bacterium]|nr:KamA family radical SAM protein [Oscillospiraceae bacterium]